VLANSCGPSQSLHVKVQMVQTKATLRICSLLAAKRRFIKNNIRRACKQLILNNTCVGDLWWELTDFLCFRVTLAPITEIESVAWKELDFTFSGSSLITWRENIHQFQTLSGDVRNFGGCHFVFLVDIYHFIRIIYRHSAWSFHAHFHNIMKCSLSSVRFLKRFWRRVLLTKAEFIWSKIL